MTELPTGDQLVDVVREAIALAMAVDVEDVRPGTLLIDELGAESIDFLDITFRLEQLLPVVIPRDDLTEQAEEIFGVESAVDAGRTLTPFGAYLIRQRLSGIPPERIEAGMRAESLATLWTADTWAGLCARLLDSVPGHCACGGERAVTRTDEGAYRAVCGTCSAELAAVPGDELNRLWFEELKDDPEATALLAGSPDAPQVAGR